MQVALGLGHLHEKKIIYRDLKPENILVNEDGYLLICDFGISKMINPDEGEISYTFIGTMEYMAPEMITAKASKNRGYDLSVDWWALGSLIYELLIGIPPFYHHNQHKMAKLIRKKELVFPDLTGRNIFVSEEAKDLIRKLLDKTPETRLGSKNDIDELKAHPWFAGMD